MEEVSQQRLPPRGAPVEDGWRSLRDFTLCALICEFSVFVPRAPSVTASRATSLPEGGSIMPLSNRKQTDKSKFEALSKRFLLGNGTLFTRSNILHGRSAKLLTEHADQVAGGAKAANLGRLLLGHAVLQAVNGTSQAASGKILTKRGACIPAEARHQCGSPHAHNGCQRCCRDLLGIVL